MAETLDYSQDEEEKRAFWENMDETMDEDKKQFDYDPAEEARIRERNRKGFPKFPSYKIFAHKTSKH